MMKCHASKTQGQFDRTEGKSGTTSFQMDVMEFIPPVNVTTSSFHGVEY